LAKRPFPVVNWDVSWICKPLCKSCYLMVCSWPWLITLLIVVSNRWNCSHMKKQFGNVPTTIDQNSYMYRSAFLIVRINTVWSLTVCAIMEGHFPWQSISDGSSIMVYGTFRDGICNHEKLVYIVIYHIPSHLVFLNVI
jgi:hypothetical protein